MKGCGGREQVRCQSVVHMGKQKAHRENRVTSAASSLSLNSYRRRGRRACSISRARSRTDPAERPPSSRQLLSSRAHTHRPTKLMTSILEAAVPVANNSQFGWHPRGRARDDGKEGEECGKNNNKNTQRELVFSSCLENNDIPGESTAT